MPLVWAHAEHIKLLRSLRDGAVFDMPPQPFDRYVKRPPPVAPVVWRMTSASLKIAVGRKLRLEFLEPAMVHVPDNWASAENNNAVATGLGTYICDLPTETLAQGRVVVFKIYWPEKNRWADAYYRISVGDV
jgi:glucoamylase